MIAMGGRIPHRLDDDGSVGATITGGRYARRIDERHALFVCAECHYADGIEPVDDGPISPADLLAALTDWQHGCATEQETLDA